MACKNSFYLNNCRNCSYCYKSNNLINKQYCIYNKQVTKEEFHMFLNNTNTQIDTSDNELIYQSLNIVNSEHAIGNDIFNSKNISLSSVIHDSENVRYAWDIYN